MISASKVVGQVMSKLDALNVTMQGTSDSAGTTSATTGPGGHSGALQWRSGIVPPLIFCSASAVDGDGASAHEVAVHRRLVGVLGAHAKVDTDEGREVVTEETAREGLMVAASATQPGAARPLRRPPGPQRRRGVRVASRS